mmetsp:Transcript_93753/g.262261  ORF Transcript_93753/g.262261 Transcript_93753/m.262261 type:complete len:271 (+) Transcript_93753:90-902(+)
MGAVLRRCVRPSAGAREPQAVHGARVGETHQSAPNAAPLRAAREQERVHCPRARHSSHPQRRSKWQFVHQDLRCHGCRRKPSAPAENSQESGSDCARAGVRVHRGGCCSSAGKMTQCHKKGRRCGLPADQRARAVLRRRAFWAPCRATSSRGSRRPRRSRRQNGASAAQLGKQVAGPSPRPPSPRLWTSAQRPPAGGPAMSPPTAGAGSWSPRRGASPSSGPRPSAWRPAVPATSPLKARAGSSSPRPPLRVRPWAKRLPAPTPSSRRTV